MPVGYWCPVLHAHLPYVRHPEYPEFLEEDWFFEALTETYVPLIRVLDGLLADGVDYRLTMTLSPPLVSMMTDELLVARYHRYLDRLVDLSGREIERTEREDSRFTDVARFYHHEFADIRRVFREVYGSNIVQAFRKHRDAGQARDHHLRRDPRLLPAHGHGAPGGARAGPGGGGSTTGSTSAGIPSGIWLPECGYMPGHEAYLKEAGIRYSFLESHGLTDAHPAPEPRRARPDRLAGRHRLLRPRHGVVAAGLEHRVGLPRRLRLPRVLQGRRLGAARSTTSKDFLPDGQRKNLGLKYYRITGKGTGLGDKQPYVRAWALEKAASHAGNFLQNRQKQVEHLAGIDGPRARRGEPLRRGAVRPLVVRGARLPELPLPEDAPRPGRREAHHAASSTWSATRSSRWSSRPMCTWGAKGYAEVWLNPGNDWIYPHLDMAAERMVELARRYEHPSDLEWRALNQAARELLLAQSSDWAFIMKTNTTVEYAKKRTRDHIARFDYLYRALDRQGCSRSRSCAEFEGRDNIFPEIDYRVYPVVSPRGAVQGPIRRSAVAGSWYPGTPALIAAEVESYLATAADRPGSRGVSWASSAPTPGSAIPGPSRPSDTRSSAVAKTSRSCSWARPTTSRSRASRCGPEAPSRRPWGAVPIDEGLAAALLDSRGHVKDAPRPHGEEHSLEMQLPFLQHLVAGLRIVPLLMGRQEREDVDRSRRGAGAGPWRAAETSCSSPRATSATTTRRSVANRLDAMVVGDVAAVRHRRPDGPRSRRVANMPAAAGRSSR